MPKIQYSREHTFDAPSIGPAVSLMQTMLEERLNNADIDEVVFSVHVRVDQDDNTIIAVTPTATKTEGVQGPDFTAENDALAAAVANTEAEGSAEDAKQHQQVIS